MREVVSALITIDSGQGQANLVFGSGAIPDVTFDLIVTTLENCDEVISLAYDGEGEILSLYTIDALPAEFVIDLPIYVPVPECSGTNEDLEYSVVGTTPDWISFDEVNRRLTIELSDSSIINESHTIRLEIGKDG